MRTVKTGKFIRIGNYILCTDHISTIELKHSNVFVDTILSGGAGGTKSYTISFDSDEDAHLAFSNATNGTVVHEVYDDA